MKNVKNNTEVKTGAKNTKSTKSKNPKTVKTAKSTKGAAKVHVGRPAYKPVFPKSEKWTFTQFAKANEGKCTILTLRKFLAKDMYITTKVDGKLVHKGRAASQVVMVKDEFAPKHKSGLGRQAFLYQFRAGKAPTAAQKSHAPAPAPEPKVEDITVDVGTGTQEVSDYEAQKAALLAPSSPVTLPETAETETATVPETAETATVPVESVPAELVTV